MTASLHYTYPLEQQRQLSDYIMSVLGIDRSHCGIAESEHPFTTGFNNKDVRITTHYHEQDVASSPTPSYTRAVTPSMKWAVDEHNNNYTGVSGGVPKKRRRRLKDIGICGPRLFLLSPPNSPRAPPNQWGAGAPPMFWRAVNKAGPSHPHRGRRADLLYAHYGPVRTGKAAHCRHPGGPASAGGMEPAVSGISGRRSPQQPLGLPARLPLVRR